MTAEDVPQNVSTLLAGVAAGDTAAADELFPIVYDELHRRAAAYMRRERDDHTLQTTALIHEAYLRLVRSDDQSAQFRNVDHFIATASIVMRRILVNHAKARLAQKRGGEVVTMRIDSVSPLFTKPAIDLIALDSAMKELRDRDATQHRIVEMRFFGGLTVEQCAGLLKMSPRTVYYEWSHARAWLRTQIEGV